MQPFQYDLRSSAAKDNSITHAAAAPSNLDAATTMRSAETELQNTIELRAMASEIATPKPWISTPKRQKDDFEALFKRNFKRKIISAKIEKICWQFTFAALMQPFQYDLRSSAAKDNSITHAAAARATLTQPLQCVSQHPVGKPAPIYGRGNIKWRQSSSHSNAICNHSFRKRMELHHTDTTTRCKTHRRNNSRTKRPQPHPSHTRGTFHRRLQPLYTEKHKVSCSGFLPKT